MIKTTHTFTDVLLRLPLAKLTRQAHGLWTIQHIHPLQHATLYLARLKSLFFRSLKIRLQEHDFYQPTLLKYSVDRYQLAQHPLKLNTMKPNQTLHKVLVNLKNRFETKNKNQRT